MSQEPELTQTEQPLGTLFGVLGYNSTSELEDFLKD